MPKQITEITFKGQYLYCDINIKKSFAVEADSLVARLLTWIDYYDEIFLLLSLQKADKKESKIKIRAALLRLQGMSARPQGQE